jgi:hypothetical protein
VVSPSDEGYIRPEQCKPELEYKWPASRPIGVKHRLGGVKHPGEHSSVLAGQRSGNFSQLIWCLCILLAVNVLFESDSHLLLPSRLRQIVCAKAGLRSSGRARFMQYRPVGGFTCPQRKHALTE